ncbi:arsenate reductase (glutaredoxin) [Poseidonibacter antarcticus]|uniref:arsenate reductase (glutaredoxin) n=1 Tax=Poseidonibacter antarcticus TaxID=2478538 RepID=UPI000EF49530|nr:arsenate reductase (glutaredoxin) [Poseidonibacter antarcticus]
MQNIQIWHNPRCSKSRNALNLLEEKGIEANVIKYLNSTPSKEELKEVLKKLGISAKELLRTGEDIYKELNLKAENDEEKIIDTMLLHPKLIERPIIIKGDKAVIARPIENLEELLK